MEFESIDGSSPHTRGTYERFNGCPAPHRFIPAHAGNILQMLGGNGVDAVHPRTRGEHVEGMIDHHDQHGSSPHTRGTSRMVCANVITVRFIPAHAGNIPRPPAAAPSSTVHPRTRGEHMSLNLPAAVSVGSSPHTRGTYDGPRAHPFPKRFIPAHAGNIHSARAGVRLAPVHPRTRGEHEFAGGKPVSGYGSSPHTRGTFRADGAVHRSGRFIPAHAGNIRRLAGYRLPASVHPRTRGEHSFSSYWRVSSAGSSPHTRGTYLFQLIAVPSLK